MKKIISLAPAKINLNLQIGELAPNGLHYISSLMQTISLYDRLVIQGKVSEGPTCVHLAGNCKDLSYGSDNLVYKAAQAWLQEAKLSALLDIFLEKKIPLEAGLGGGSSDAAACLLGLNRLFPANALDDLKLARLAFDLGSDVSFFLHKGTGLVEVFGDRITPLAFDQKLYLLLIKPPLNLSAGSIFKLWDLKLASGYRRPYELKDIFIPQNGVQNCTVHFEDLLTNQEIWQSSFYNDFEPILRKEYLEIDLALNYLESTPAFQVSLSGSGPTCFGVFPNEVERNRAMTQAKDRPELAAYTIFPAESLSKNEIQLLEKQFQDR